MKKYFLVLFIIVFKSFSQAPVNKIETNLSPNGVLENVFDHYGNKYKLSDLVIGKEVRDENSQVLRATNPLPMTCGYYNLYFEDGCGMENTSNPTHMARRAVVCQVFTDISNFISSDLTFNGKKVNIWVRNLANIGTIPSNVMGLASSFYSVPYNNTNSNFGGIVDGEIWKTIHLGQDSYKNVISPLSIDSSNSSASATGYFYHGMVAFRFDGSVSWNTNLSATTITNIDLYSVALHEITHALGFASLIGSTGASKLGVGFNYYNRYDLKLKNSINTNTLISNTGACSSMYNYKFNSTILTASTCSNAIKYVGTSVVTTYTPSVFSDGSSLSHFDSSCTAGNFVMNSSTGLGLMRRFYTVQEKNAIVEMGYTVNPSFGVSTTYNGTATYSAPFNGVTVAGMNDGIETNGLLSYTYIIGSASPLTINSSTNSLIRILTNDKNATGFECLQDITDPTSTTTITGSSGTATTNITFTSTVAGLHLLRYVPINGTGASAKRGNITYIYVMVEPNGSCITATTCDLIKNGNFEQKSTPLSSSGTSHISDACGWSQATFNGTSDYLNSDYISYLTKVPCSMFGYQEDKVLGNKGYGGLAIRKNPLTIDAEPIKTILVSPLQPNTSYQLSFDLSLAEGGSANCTKIQAYLSNDVVSYPGNIPIANLNMFFTSNSFNTKTDGWEKVVFNFTTGSVAGQKCLYLGGLNQYEINRINPAPQNIGGCGYMNANANTPGDINLEGFSYYFIDNVSLIPLNGGSFTLPTQLCSSDSILTNLNNYLNGLPINGVYSGAGVVLNAGVYSFDPSIATLGTNTIAYTYTNSSGCSVSIYSNVVVEYCSCNCLSTLYFTSANTATTGIKSFTVSNSNPACIVDGKHSWSFGDGTSLLTYSPTINHTYTSTGTFNVSLVSRVYGTFDELLCSSEKQTLAVSVVGGKTGKTIEEDNMGDKSVLIYPNPASLSTNIKLELNNNENVTFAFRTIDGKEVLRKEMFLSKGTQIVEIDIPSTINDGIILVEVSYNNYKIVKKLNIKK